MDTEFCLAALAEALESYGIPEIFNTDQGSQFTSIAFTGLLETAGIRCLTGMGCEGIRGRTGARAWEVIHIYTGSFTPSPDPTPVTAA